MEFPDYSTSSMGCYLHLQMVDYTLPMDCTGGSYQGAGLGLPVGLAYQICLLPLRQHQTLDSAGFKPRPSVSQFPRVTLFRFICTSRPQEVLQNCHLNFLFAGPGLEVAFTDPWGLFLFQLRAFCTTTTCPPHPHPCLDVAGGASSQGPVTLLPTKG